MSTQLRIYVPDHPLVKHWLSIARDVNTPNVLFKTAMTELGRWLTYEASRYWLPTVETAIQSPLSITQGTLITQNSPTAIIPVLRAGLALLDGAQTVLPVASTYHIGLVRDEQTLEVSCYFNKLPQQFTPDTRILILDPMLATGGTMLYVLEQLVQRGADPALMRIVSVVCAPPALQKLSQLYPTLNIYAAIIDPDLNDHGFIVPGLGDAGDRAFGT